MTQTPTSNSSGEKRRLGWGDIAAIVTILSVLTGGIAWANSIAVRASRVEDAVRAQSEEIKDLKTLDGKVREIAVDVRWLRENLKK
jgi:hypothetical protein